MSINSISQAMAGSAWGANTLNLPEWIVQKLIELGYSPSDVSSISEAKDLIKKSESSDSNLNQGGQNSGNLEQDKDNPALYLRAKALAQKIGLNTNENDTLDKLLGEISNAVDAIMKQAIKDEDESLFNLAKGFKSELTSIEQEANGGGISNTIVYSFLDMLASQNKYALGLNH